MGQRDARGGDDDFLIKGAQAVGYLSRDRERDLLRRWCVERDETARSEIVAAHMRISVSLARKMGKYGLPFADLVQEGNIGLMEAANRFDPAHEVRFSTYATWWVRSAIQEYTLRNWSVVRMASSRQQKQLFFNLRRLRARIESSQGRDATRTSVNEAIAVDLGIDVKVVERAVERLALDTSLNATVGDEDGTLELMDMLADEGMLPDAMAEEAIDGERLRAALEVALSGLSTRERVVIERRKLCDKEDTETLERLSATFGVTRERVRQIEVAAIKKLHVMLSASPVLLLEA